LLAKYLIAAIDQKPFQQAFRAALIRSVLLL